MKKLLFGMAFFASAFFIVETSNAQDESIGTIGYEEVYESCSRDPEVIVMRCRWNDLTSCNVSGQELCP